MNRWPPELPDELKQQLRTFEGRLRGMETVAAAGAGVAGLLAGYLLLFGFDRLVDTPRLLRLLFAVAGLAAPLAVLLWWAGHWGWARRDARALSRLVQRHFPRMGDRLLGAVELAGNGTDVEVVSPALRRAAIRQVAAETRAYDFRRAVDTRRPRRLALAAAAALGGVSVLVWVAPEAARNALSRWFRPLAPLERYTFVGLDALPAELVVPHGEPFEIACRLKDRSRWKPAAAQARIEDQPVVSAVFRGGLAVFRFPGQTRAGRLNVRAGDATRHLSLRPMYRPELARLAADVQWPGYLGRAPDRLPVENASIQILQGATVAFEGQANRPVSAAEVSRATVRPLAVSGAVFRTEALPLDQWLGGPAPATGGPPRAAAIEFRWTDTHGLHCTTPFRLELRGRSDEPPLLQCEGLRGSVAILEDETVTMKVIATDDFGVQRLWVDWWEERAEGGAAPAVRSRAPAAGAPDRTRLEGSTAFSPVALGIREGSTLNVCARAMDYFPDRTPSESPVYRIFVLSRAEHARLLQERFRDLQTRLEEAVREEERLLNANAGLAEDTHALATARAEQALAENERGERMNAAQVQRLAEDLARLAREGLRNRDVAAATLREWAEIAARMQSTAGGPMNSAAQAMRQAAMNAARRSEDLQQAMEQQAAALEALRGMIESGSDSLDTFTARNFINRLREAARREEDLGAGLRQMLPRTVGMETGRLGRAEVSALQRLAGAHEENRREVKYIRDDLGGFFALTRKPIYDEVRREMSDPDVVEDLQGLTARVLRNLAGESIVIARAATDRFNAWADRLEKAAGEGGGGGGGGGGGQGIEADVLLGLMRARVREESLREQTRGVDEARAEHPDYPGAAGKLSDRQREIGQDVRRLSEKTANRQVAQFAGQLGDAMDEIAGLLKRPDTGAMTIAGETAIIEALAGAIQSCAGSQGAGAQQMAQMMGQGQSQAGGGSRAGGATDRDNIASGGAAAGSGDPSRRVERGSGVDASRLPEEFRDVMQAYFNALEVPK